MMAMMAMMAMTGLLKPGEAETRTLLECRFSSPVAFSCYL